MKTADNTGIRIKALEAAERALSGNPSGALSGIDRLRLHIHDPETHAFDNDDLEAVLDEIDAALTLIHEARNG